MAVSFNCAGMCSQSSQAQRPFVSRLLPGTAATKLTLPWTLNNLLACLQMTLEAALVNPLAQAATQAPRCLTSSRPAKPVPTDLAVRVRRTVAARGGS